MTHYVLTAHAVMDIPACSETHARAILNEALHKLPFDTTLYQLWLEEDYESDEEAQI